MSNSYEHPTIIRDAFVQYFLGYDGLRNGYKLIRFNNAARVNIRTIVHCFTIGRDED
jgi:hypothetical protein